MAEPACPHRWRRPDPDPGAPVQIETCIVCGARRRRVWSPLWGWLPTTWFGSGAVLDGD